MIPIHMTVAGFLSYHQVAELDFTGFSLACIAGANGAGKSSLLDAITWTLFGVARKSDESLINAQSLAAEVRLVFAYEGNIYRVQRSKPRGKVMTLEFHILQDSGEGSEQERHRAVARGETGAWKVLTEHTLRETQARIEHTLRMDYETFTNASFFLQGKADQFTQQGAGDRKRILGSILGLEAWETYRQEAAERRRKVEEEITGLDGQMREINPELAEEPVRLRRLQELETELEQVSRQRAEQEATRESLRAAAVALEQQGKLVETLKQQLEQVEASQGELAGRLEVRRQERQAYSAAIGRAGEIEAAYAAWQEARRELEKFEEIAGQFRAQEKRRAELLAVINEGRARLEVEFKGLKEQQEEAARRQAEIAHLQTEVEAALAYQRELEEKIGKKDSLEAELRAARDAQSTARAENTRLKVDMDELRERIDRLTQVEGAACPVCGQTLSQVDRQALIETLETQGKEMGDRFRANQALAQENDRQLKLLDQERAGLARLEVELRGQSGRVANLESRLEGQEGQQARWEESGANRLREVQDTLEKGNYANEARQKASQLEAELKATGYEAAAHDQARRTELGGRPAEQQVRELEKARATLAPLEREIGELETQAAILTEQVQRQRKVYGEASLLLAEAQAHPPDIVAAENRLIVLQERENSLRQELGAARQRVHVLGDLKKRRNSLEGSRQENARLVGMYKQLERAFSKDGVPALLIEQALPQIESKANEILDRLSAGSMSVRFLTQAAYKDKKREDMKETLEIRISDSAGTRDYEMFSGGEAFRINFAIRLALSEVLAQRAGARLQTLVIDEGFGSQDTEGRQRLIEAINLVKADFAKILVITHIDELKDAFPNRIEVEKTRTGSVLSLL